jgi:hypothetical protein
MLQMFLNRVARHPIFSNEHVFHRFLDGEVSWVRLFSYPFTGSSELMSCLYENTGRSPPLPPTLPSSPKTHSKPPHTTPQTPPQASPAYNALPTPSSAAPPPCAPRPALPRLRSLHQQVRVAHQRADGESHAAHAEALE